jgi:hypothetical protein
MLRIKNANKANELIEKIRDLQEFVHDWQDEQTFSAPIVCLAEFTSRVDEMCHYADLMVREELIEEDRIGLQPKRNWREGNDIVHL